METINSDVPEQNIVFEPYTQKFYSYYDHVADTVKYYITPEFGNYTKIVGTDTILEGFEVDQISTTSTSVSCRVGQGRAIIDSTYVEIESTETIEYPSANVFDDSGFFVLSMRFNNHHTLRSNKVTYHLTYFTSHNVSYEDFDITENLIVLNVFNFSKSENAITEFINNDLISTIVLDGKVYTIRKNTTDTINTLVDGGLIDYDPTDLSTGRYVGGSTILELIELLKSTGVINTLTVT